jgi:hypothetical protein
VAPLVQCQIALQSKHHPLNFDDSSPYYAQKYIFVHKNDLKNDYLQKNN